MQCILILLGIAVICLLKAVAQNHDILIAILIHALNISRVELNLWEDDSSSCEARRNRQRIEQAATCANGPIFPVSPYFRLKPGFMEEWPLEGIALMRVASDYRSHVDEGSCWSVCGNCKSITTGSQAPAVSIHRSKPSSLTTDRAVWACPD